MKKLKALTLLTSLLVLSAGFTKAEDKMATFFMGRLKYSTNDGDDCSGVGQDLMKLVSKASSIKVQEERHVKLSDPQLFETPFLFMNGHDDFVLTEAEIKSLRKYLGHGGFIMGSGCCTNPEFPKAWRREFSRIFVGEAVNKLPYDHLIYRSFYQIGRVKSLDDGHEIQLEGLFFEGNLVAVMCEDGLCCSFAADNNCNSGHGIAPADGKKFALNIAVFALTH